MRVGRLEFRVCNFMNTTFKMSIYLRVGGLGFRVGRFELRVYNMLTATFKMLIHLCGEVLG